MEQNLFPSNCTSCGFWSVFEADLVKGGLNMTCTNCNDSKFLQGTQKEMRDFISNSRKYVKVLALTNPEVLQLKNRGDHIDPPKAG